MKENKSDIEKACQIIGISKDDVKNLSKEDIQKILDIKLSAAKTTGDAQAMNDLASAYATLLTTRPPKKESKYLRGVVTLGIVTALGIGGYHLVHNTVDAVQSFRLVSSSDFTSSNEEDDTLEEPYQYEPIHNTYEDEEMVEGDYTVYRQVAFDQNQDNMLDMAEKYGVDVGEIEMANSPETMQQGILIIPYVVNYDDLSLVSVDVLEGETINQFVTRTETALSTLKELNEGSFKEDGNCYANALLVPDYNALTQTTNHQK